MNVLSLSDAVSVEVTRSTPNDARSTLIDQLRARLHPKGRFVVQHYRNGERINEYQFPNGIVDEGANRLLGVMFNAATQIGTWYIGLINNSGFTALANTDNYDNIDQAGNGWDEFASYTDANNAGSAVTRPTWPENAPSARSITNSTVAIFDITATATVKGVFVVGGTNAQTKSDHTAGTANALWATALFASGDVPVVNGDQLKITYTVSA